MTDSMLIHVGITGKCEFKYYILILHLDFFHLLQTITSLHPSKITNHIYNLNFPLFYQDLPFPYTLKLSPMNSQHYQNHLGTMLQDLKPLNQDQLRQNCDINKDSVNTSIGSYQKTNEPTLKHSLKTNNYSLHQNKTKFIWKPQIKKAAPILKHKKVVQTLKNITKNIKNQLNSLRNPTTLNPNDQSKQNGQCMMEVQNDRRLSVKIIQTSQKPQIQQKKNKVQPSNNLLSKSMENMKIEELQKENYTQKLVNLNEQGNSKTYQQPVSPQRHGTIIKVPQQIFLYSKYKGITESYPVYDDCMLSDKKEFRNLTIHRQLDNDVDSDQQQIQMGVGFMYEQLIYSCHKHSEMKLKQQNLALSNNSKKCKNDRQHVPLEKIKQKLVFR